MYAGLTCAPGNATITGIMKIRVKRTLLLLGFALVPATIVCMLHVRSLRNASEFLSTETRGIIESNAKQHLEAVVSDFGELLRRDRTNAEHALTIMARGIEERLSCEVPANTKVHYATDYDSRKNVPADLQYADGYNKSINGQEQPIRVSFTNPVFYLTDGDASKNVKDNIARLSDIGNELSELLKHESNSFTWMYAGFESGLHMSYPGHGGYPKNFDPRNRPWYKQAKKQDSLVWHLLPDVSTRKVSLTVSTPIRNRGGKFIGVAGIDVKLSKLLGGINLPDQWQASAVILQVHPGEETSGKTGDNDLLIVAQESYESQGEDWEKPIKWNFLRSPDSKELAAMKKDILAGKAGVRRMRLNSLDAFWAYSKWTPGQSLAVVVVPYEKVIAQAAATEKFMQDEFVLAVKAVGFVMLAVLVAAIMAAMHSSRRLTRPVSQLVNAARQLSDGNFEARVNITTGDELQDLGDVFNNMGPKLEREQTLSHSLEVAREIQQRLLPQSTPQLDGFDIAGKSIYCDETGGDYYDFIDLSERMANSIGLAIGDITGHGIQAALLMATTRGLLRSHAVEYPEDLARLMHHMNEHLVADTDPHHFLTLFYAVLDTNNATLKWNSAGHDAGLWLRPGETQFRKLDTTGALLGVVGGMEYEDVDAIKLQSKDVIFVGTDGIWEARNTRKELFGKDRLEAIVRENADKSSAEIMEVVFQAVSDYRGPAPQTDDITMLVIKML